MSKILILPGDGIGKEIVAQALKVIDSLNVNDNLGMELVHGLIGGSAYDETGSPLPEETLTAAKECDSILLGAVGGYQWEALDRPLRPERGLLGLRAELDLFSNSLHSANSIIGLREIESFLAKRISMIELKEKVLIKTRQYAKRQYTWQRGQMKDWKGFEDTNYLDLRKKVLSYLSKT